MVQQASPYVAKRVYSFIADSGISCFWYYRSRQLFVFLEVLHCAVLRVYTLIVVISKSWQWNGKS